MDRLGIQSLNAGAPDLRLTGDQTQRGTYTQRRRDQMAYGGIAGLDGRMQYGIGSFFQKAKDKVVGGAKKLVDIVKDNPMLATLGGGALLNQFGIPFTGTAGDRMGQNWMGELLGKIPGTGGTIDMVLGQGGTGQTLGTGIKNLIYGMPDAYSGVKGLLPPSQGMGGELNPLEYAKQYLTDYVGSKFNLPGTGSGTGPGTGQDSVNWKGPLSIGMGIGAADYLTRKDDKMPPQLAIDPSRFATAEAAMADEDLRFKPETQYALAADGGRIGYDNGGLGSMDFVDKIYSDEARTLAGTSGKPGGLLQERTETGEYRFPEDITMPGQAHTRETLDAANKMLDIQEMKKLQLEKIALKKGWSKAKFNKKYKEYVEQQAGGIAGWGDSTQYDDLNEALRFMEHDLGVYSDWEGDQDFRLQDPNYKSMYVSGNAQGGRIGYERGRVVRPGGYSGVIDRNIANLTAALETATTDEERAEIQALLDRQIEAKGGVRDKLLSGDPVPETEDEGSFWDFLPFVGKAQGGRIGYADGTPNVPEGFIEDFKRKKYEEMLNEFRRHREDYDRRRMMAPTEEAAQGGRIGAQEGGLMDLGGMEKDYRQEGGFVPIGGQEKADDVPARLSKNEFVFTADAVRSAGGGDIDKGAEIMENLMENLEAGGKVSEESQGLEGAREMFANAQALEKRII